jgi:cytochrome c oxidase subunit 4
MAHDDHGGLRKYLIVGALLAVLTAISFLAGSSNAIMSTPALGWTIMMAVSCAKALLVMLFFMHLIWEANWKYVLTVPASIMSLFLLLMLTPDVGYRYRGYSEERLRFAAEKPRESRSPSEQAAEDAGNPTETPHGGH